MYRVWCQLVSGVIMMKRQSFPGRVNTKTWPDTVTNKVCIVFPLSPRANAGVSIVVLLRLGTLSFSTARLIRLLG